MVVGEFVQERQLIVIGGGPGGYQAAIRAAQLGLDVTLVEKNELGGICLHEGCMPSKVVTEAAERWQQTVKGCKLGIPEQREPFKWDVLRRYQTNVVEQLKQGIVQLCKGNKIEYVVGEASFLSAERISVTNGHQYEIYSFQHVILATGQYYVSVTEENERLLTPYSLFQLEKLPPSLVIVGHQGYEIEAAFAYQSLGVEVTLLLDGAPPIEKVIEKEWFRSAKKAGMKIKQDIEFESVQLKDASVAVVYSRAEKREEVQAALGYVSPNWKGQTGALSLKRVGIETDQDGYITVTSELKTTKNNVYAIGDVNKESFLATAAIQQGKVVAELLAGHASRWDPTILPTVYRTQPPLAMVGLTQEQAKKSGIDTIVGTASFRSNGFSLLSHAQDGIITILKDKERDDIIGVQMVGTGATELIVSATIGMELGMRDEDLIFPMYPHPCVGEVLMEAAEDLQHTAIHKPRATKQTQK
ncbi:NAD(P)/FAD-dependent oxidoreductase [Shouchella miscanthi]|uniref:Dihydrolipoyl dehydrogenase n=1 Tax=Shouchella miscanthi TaxID=2598861 RepID=A0ABU6NJY8_9BACI|nr:NAD(P)/FAD-dependent oxidoreductase [Shouchella miscanthi]